MALRVYFDEWRVFTTRIGLRLLKTVIFRKCVGMRILSLRIAYTMESEFYIITKMTYLRRPQNKKQFNFAKQILEVGARKPESIR